MMKVREKVKKMKSEEEMVGMVERREMDGEEEETEDSETEEEEVDDGDTEEEEDTV